MQVVSNAILALNEIMCQQGGIVTNQSIIHHLLNRIKSFNEWGQCVVLDLVAQYKPKSQEEIFAIMNLLDSSLRVNNSAVVIACTKCFLTIARDLDSQDIKKQVYMRLKQPLLTIMAFNSSEVVHCVVSHILLIAGRAPGIFDDEYKQFFCNYSEPSCVQYLKIEVLPVLANDRNCIDIASELGEYALSTSSELSKRAIVAMGKIGLKVGASVSKIVAMLVEFTAVDVTKNHAVIALKDILRLYPSHAKDVISW